MMRTAPTSLRSGRVRALPATVAFAALVALLSACTTVDDLGHGLNTRELLASQHIDPAATARNGSRVTTTEGRTVRESVERQVDSFRAPPTSAVQGVGTVGGK
jgi:hypothetical protein